MEPREFNSALREGAIHNAEQKKRDDLIRDLIVALDTAITQWNSWVHSELDGTSRLDAALADIKPVRAVLRRAERQAR